LRSLRKAIPHQKRILAAEEAVKHLLREPLFEQSERIGCYVASPEEFDCSLIIEAIRQLKKKCYLPIISKSQEKFLEFAEYNKHDELKPNQFQILEPINTPVISPAALDLVIAPLVGFDSQGNRLGMGAGFYDRTFSFLNININKKKETKPILIGLGYQSQQIAELPREPWDVRLQAVLTEKGFYSFFEGDHTHPV